MKSIKPFQFEENQIRIVLDDNGRTWLILRDVLAAMNSTVPVTTAKAAIEEGLGDGFTASQPIVDSLGRTQKAIVINEHAVTFLISRSNTDIGRRLNRFIHSEVLPSIRETGSYSVKDHPQWLQAREQGKIARREETDTIKAFIEYAKGQGGTPSGCDRYYATITTEEYKALFLADEFKNLRERLPFGDLATLMVAEEIVKRALQQGMDDGLHYKDVYKLAKSKLLNFSDLKGKKPVAQTRLMH